MIAPGALVRGLAPVATVINLRFSSVAQVGSISGGFLADYYGVYQNIRISIILKVIEY